MPTRLIDSTVARPEKTAILAELERILSTDAFQHSQRYPAFLRYVVEQTVRGASDDLKEKNLGVTVFRRSAGYDTSADPVVRNTASEVRKRLQEYYSRNAHESEVVIALPAGSYVPEFRLKIPVPDSVPAESKSPSFWLRLRLFPMTTTSRTFLLAILGLCGAAVGLTYRRADSPAKLFWGPLLNAPDSILVVTEPWRRDQSADAASPAMPAVSGEIDPKTFLYIAEQSSKLTTFLLGNGKRLNYELARNVTMSKLRERPFVLRGAFNNRWTLRAVSPFRFHFEFEPDVQVRRIVDRQDPARRDWSAPLGKALTEDYALVARAPEPNTGQTMVVVAGLAEQGTAAALEFVTNPKYLARFAAQAPAGWAKHNVEMVLQTRLTDDEWGEPRVVATHFWQ